MLRANCGLLHLVKLLINPPKEVGDLGQINLLSSFHTHVNELVNKTAVKDDFSLL